MSKDEFNRNEKKYALWFFLGTEVIALCMAVGWLVKINVEKIFYQGPTFVYIEKGLETPINSDLLEYNLELSGQDRVKIMAAESKESGVSDFIEDQTDLLVLANPLATTEVNRINAKRLPLEQKEIKLAINNIPTKCYLIYDRDTPRKVRKFVNKVVQVHS
jgi:hypothetical protein